MGRVHVLPPEIADRIAAGEVVERPASVVRELLDNALDAGATRVEVDLEGGGRELVRVADDGEGLSRDDAVLAFERHATSKVARGEDLDRIVTLGFRGEALAAIAAVARVEMVTRERGTEEGTRVVLEKGRLLRVEPAPRAEGTTVEVRALFAGIPARRKFLKSEATELDHCLRAVVRAALARPEVGFRVRHGTRRLVSVPPGQEPGARVVELLGRKFGRDWLPAEGNAGPLAVRAWLARPEAARPGRDGIHLFVNRRPVRDPFLLRAVLDAYRGVLPEGRFPAAVVFLELPPEEVDVNVHPAKTEVRFRRPRDVRALLVGVLGDALGTPRAMGTLPGPWRGASSPREPGGPAPRGAPGTWAGWPGIPAGSSPAGSPLPGLREGMEAGSGAWPGPAPGSPANRGEAPEQGGVAPAPGEPAGDRPPRVLAQLRNCYILAEDERGLVLVDQHVAHERVLYERLLDQLDEGELPRQALLFAEPLEVGPGRVAVARERVEDLLRLGFEVEPFGEEAVIVRQVPAIYGRSARADVVVEVLDRLGEGDRPGAEPAFHRVLSTVACHAAVRAGMELDRARMEWIVRGLWACRRPTHCPHGRPVLLRVDFSAIDRAFERA